MRRPNDLLAAASAPADMPATILAIQTRVGHITACGLEARDVFSLCRRLVADGHDGATPLETRWADGRPSLRVRSIGEGALLQVRETPEEGPRLVRWRPMPNAFSAGGGRSPVREEREGGPE